MLRQSKKCQLGVEVLESRLLPSWSSIPPSSVNLTATAGVNKISISRFDRDGTYGRTATINNGEVDYRTFVAERSGTYTFEAAKYNGSSIDTVAALFSDLGKRLAYNDDASNSTRNSKFTADLVAGKTYVFGVTNYRYGPEGSYQVMITAGSIGKGDILYSRDVTQNALATLSGSTLTIRFDVYNNTAFANVTHEVTVQIVDRSGQAIHTGLYRGRTYTAGTFVSGNPSSRTATFTFDVSNLDLGRASRLVVSQRYF